MAKKNAPKKKAPKKKSQQLLESAPPSVGAKRKPIGVPEGYVAQLPTKAFRTKLHADPSEAGSSEEFLTTTPVVPRYFQGDEWFPAQFSVEDRAVLQIALSRAGLLDPDRARLGIWDDASRGAFNNLLEMANSTGRDWGDALTELGKSTRTVSGKAIGGGGGGRGGGGRARAPLTVRLASPEDLKDMFTAVAVKRLGRSVTEDELSHMVSAYHGVERQFQTQAYQAAETGGAVIEPPSAEAFAEKRLREEKPIETGAYDVVNQFQALLRILGVDSR